MVNQQSAITTVESFIMDIKKLGLKIRKVILFGSYAKNKQQEYSDIDVAIVSDEFTGVGFEDIKLFVKSLKNYILIQPKTYNTNYFEQGDPFIEEIIRTGIEIKV